MHWAESVSVYLLGTVMVVAITSGVSLLCTILLWRTQKIARDTATCFDRLHSVGFQRLVPVEFQFSARKCLHERKIGFHGIQQCMYVRWVNGSRLPSELFARNISPCVCMETSSLHNSCTKDSSSTKCHQIKQKISTFRLCCFAQQFEPGTSCCYI